MKKLGKMLPLILGTVARKPATLLYPFEPAQVPEKFRGKLKFDPERCIGCKICMRECPAKAIEIEKIGEEKKFKAVVYLDRCIYCGQCCEACPKQALENTTEFELAHFQRDKLKVDI
ncbi:MAG: 4Fe-4S binding protein [Candidatus Omnitrophota bacterium]